ERRDPTSPAWAPLRSDPGAARPAFAGADGRRTICARAGAARDICLDTVAVGGAVAAIRPRRLRPCVGRPRTGGLGLAGRGVPCVAPFAPRVVPADAQG